jgi:hypothetical protein
MSSSLYVESPERSFIRRFTRLTLEIKQIENH